MERKTLTCWAAAVAVLAAAGATAGRGAPLVVPIPGAAASEEQDGAGREVGHPTFNSPHANPIAIVGGRVYVANTPADTVDVIDAERREVVRRIHVGIDPVSVAARPDGREVWVGNHVSDSVSVIDSDPRSRTFGQVVATVQDVDPDTLATRFDEPVGIAFANNRKAYVALSTSNRVAVVNVRTRQVTKHLPIRAQDPRALAVRHARLYVIPFESNNQSQLSGCLADDIDGDVCTFDAFEHVFANNNVLSENYEADIVKNLDVPDRDLFVFHTITDRPLRTVETVGTLLYGLAVDSRGRVFVAQTDARNTANGRAGTRQHGLAEMENRAFLNQITRVDCASGCGSPRFYDLEPLPPRHPEPGMALATPFGIQVSDDDSTLVATAAGSDRLFTVDVRTGQVLGRVAVGAAPRGVALVSDADGAPDEAWVLNAVANSVSLVDVSSPSSPTLLDTVELQDPTHPVVKQGRIAFNDADASSTGTFSCESCHPDGHTDQLIWVLDTPNCGAGDGPVAENDEPRKEQLDRGCTQVPPRLTMPVRGLRDTQPYHWDGIPGDPYGGRNTESILVDVDPNCQVDEPESCTRHLVDGSLATTMCDVGDCPANDEGDAGLLDGDTRDALARFILSIPYPPAPSRPLDNALTRSARDGFFEFSFINDAGGRATGAQTCGDCHKMPFLVSTNTPGTGMEAPTWRGAYDRFMITPQARTNVIALMDLVDMPDEFPEREMWILAGASEHIWQMVVQGSTGFHGGFARQVTLNEDSAEAVQTGAVLDVLEAAAEEGAIELQGEGVRFVDGEAAPLALAFEDGAYAMRDGTGELARSTLVAEAAAGDLVVTLTGRAGPNVDVEHPQPALWPVAALAAQTQNVHLPFLGDDLMLRVNGRHVREDAAVFVNGRRVAGEVSCEQGSLPGCDDEIVLVRLQSAPVPGGIAFLQLQNPGGLFSNDMMFFNEQSRQPSRPSPRLPGLGDASPPGNLIWSGGGFATRAEWDQHLRGHLWEGARRSHWNTVELVTDSIGWRDGAVDIAIREAHEQPWRAQLSHAVMVNAGQQYTLCYRAKAQGPRVMTAYLDTNNDSRRQNPWQNISGRQFEVDLTTAFQTFKHTFVVDETDLRARVAFDFAQSALDVQIDDIGLYEGSECGLP